MTLIDNPSKAFFKMIKSIDDLSCVGTGIPYGEVRPKDLTFIDTSSLEGNGFVYWVKIKGAETTCYRLYRMGNMITLCCPTDGEIICTYPVEDVEIEGRVTGIYRELPSVPMVDMQKYSRMFESIKKTDCEVYQPTLGEIKAIRARRKGSPLACIIDAFRWGFLKGQCCEKARAKRNGIEERVALG